MSDYLVPMLIGFLGGFWVAVQVVKLMPGERFPRFQDEPTRVKSVMFVVPMAMTFIAALLVFMENLKGIR